MTPHSALPNPEQASPAALRKAAAPLHGRMDAADVAETTCRSIMVHCGRAMRAAANSMPALARDLLKGLNG